MGNKISLIYNAKYFEISMFLSKMIKTNLPLLCPLCFFVLFAVFEVNTVGRSLRFSRNDRTVEVIKLFITWLTKRF